MIGLGLPILPFWAICARRPLVFQNLTTKKPKHKSIFLERQTQVYFISFSRKLRSHHGDLPEHQRRRSNQATCCPSVQNIFLLLML
jgi:hypothetical protein